mmetsp:Transcript_699/g.533  ORF Transcript_699/g.533 Transcript_699/m.533 type:complete len:153 (+) Transcript_699:242-700(+)
MLCHVREPEKFIKEAFRVLDSEGCIVVFDGDYATTTVATDDSDPLQNCVNAWLEAFVYDPWLIRRLSKLIKSIGFIINSTNGYSYIKTSEPGYMLIVIDRGVDVLADSGSINMDKAEALKAEACRRVENGEFFGHIAYASFIAQKPIFCPIL